MSKDYREYRTGQGVPLTGNYKCQSGEKARLTEKDEFPACPITGKDTYWKHEEQ